MTDQILQFLLTGVTVGATYALVALGFAIIYNASDVVNFAQGEFVMLGAMSAIALSAGDGLPLWLSLLLAVLVTVGVGLLLQRFAIAPARGASVVTTIIITIGASIFLRGVALLLWGKDIFALPHFQRRAAYPYRRGHTAAAEPLGDGRRRRSWCWAYTGSSTIRSWARQSWPAPAIAPLPIWWGSTWA